MTDPSVPEGWLQFAPDKPHAYLHPDVAAKVLQLMWAEDKSRLGVFIVEAQTGVRPTGRRARRGDSTVTPA
jgi:hypothetical protein